MNEYMSQPEEVVNIGVIKVIGGEKDSFQKEAIKGTILDMTPKSTASGKELRRFEKFLKDENIPREFLKEIKIEEKEKLLEAEKQLNGRYTPIIAVEDVIRWNEIKSKINCLDYILRKRTISMTKPKVVYEIRKGEKMKVEIFDKTNEFTFIRKQKDGSSKKVINLVPDKSFQRRCDIPESNEGELKNKDIVGLFISGRLGVLERIKSKNTFVPLRNKTDVYKEDEIVPGVRSMIKKNLIHVRIRKDIILFSLLKRKVYSLRDRSKEEISFLLNLKNEAVKIKDCSYYDKERKDDPEFKNAWVDLRALSYNMLDYEANHIVVIAKQDTLNHIDRRVNKLHEEYYDFENDEGERVVGIYGLTKNEESALKQIKYEKSGFDESEIEELFEIFEERNADGKLRIKGNQNIRNIEYDIRNHERARYILSKSSDELFFLKVALEDALDEDITVDSWKYDNFKDYSLEVEKALNKNKRNISKKKLRALINVVSGLHLRYEEEEDMGKYLSDELDEIDKVSHQRDNKSYKTHRNYYSQTIGVLAPNGDPQETHKRRSNPPSMDRIRNLRKQHRNVIVGRYAGITHEYDSGEENFVVTFCRNADKEIFGDNTPNNSSFEIKYPVYPITDVGLDIEDKESLHQSLTEISGYLSDEKEAFVRNAIFEYIGEKYPAPQFKVPDYTKRKIDYSKICELCNHEKECFLEMHKRRYALLKAKPVLKYGKELGLDTNDVDVVKGVYEEIKGYLPRRRMINRKAYENLPRDLSEIKIQINRRKAIRFGFIKVERVEKPSTPSIIGENMYKITLKVKGKDVSVYAKGNLDVLKYPSVSIAGIREPADETKTFVKETVKELAEEYVIISGLAEGCDTIAHQTALEENTFTIAVLPCGFNEIYPPKNEKLANKIVKNGGLLISQYHPNTKTNKERLVKRNEIIAALSETVIICEAGNGTKHTARFAEEQGKNILVQNINTFNNNSMVELGIGSWYHRDRV